MQAVTLAVAEARAINKENRNATVIFISGTTGRFATLVNGPYAPSQLNGLDGRRLYRKISDDTICIQHRSHADQSLWRVQRAEQKDTDYCVAFIDGGCALHSCTSRVWHVHNNGAEFQEQPNVEMVAAVNAEQKVSSNVLIELLQFTNHETENLSARKFSQKSIVFSFTHAECFAIICPFAPPQPTICM